MSVQQDMELQAEIKQLHLTTDHLRASILNERRKHSELEKENSYLKNERIKGQEKLRDAENLVSNRLFSHYYLP